MPEVEDWLFAEQVKQHKLLRYQAMGEMLSAAAEGDPGAEFRVRVEEALGKWEE
jgi:hypothetical protein